MILVILALKIVDKFQKLQSLSSSTKGLESAQTPPAFPLRSWCSLPLLVPTLLLQEGASHSSAPHLEARPHVSRGFHPPSLRCCPDAESWEPQQPLKNTKGAVQPGSQAEPQSSGNSCRALAPEPLRQANTARRVHRGHTLVQRRKLGPRVGWLRDM